MLLLDAFEWKRMLLGEDTGWYFLFEVLFRTAVMYLLLIAFFKVTGKTGLKQLSPFDFILLIGLGSAAGDPMFYAEVPLLHIVVVFATILLLYRFVNRLTQKSHRLDKYLEGSPACVLTMGVIDHKELEKQGLTSMQFYSELRQQNVSQLGQVRYVYVEASGQSSVLFVAEEEVRPGLPLLLHLLDEANSNVDVAGLYSCVKCGYTKTYVSTIAVPNCNNCGCKKVVKAIDEKRIS